jgi:hypothetical protein
MPTSDTVASLTGFAARGAGTDAERRAARWLCSELEATGRDARVEPFWCRPNWALAHAWHVLLALAGGLLSVSSAQIGGVLIVAALVSLLSDAFSGRSLGRLLTPERASQNVVSVAADDEPRVRLLITANYDAGRTGLSYRDTMRAPFASLKRWFAEAPALGWLGWLTIAFAWLLVVAIIRLGEQRSTPLGIAELPPTVALVLALALLLEIATSHFGPAANDNASGVAVATALVRALGAAPPRALAVELVLQGAGDGGGIGLRRHLQSRRGTLRAANTVVLGIAPCGAGEPRWWISDGPLIPLRYFKRLRELSAEVAEAESYLHAAPHRSRGQAPPFPARLAALPAIALGCVDERGLAANSHLDKDTAERTQAASMDATLELALALVDAIDAEVARTPRPEPKPRARARRRERLRRG